MNKRLSLCLIMLALPFLALAQDVIPDTLLVRTIKNPLTNQKHFIIQGKTEMIVYYGSEKNDTTYLERWSDGIDMAYRSALRTYNIRLKPVDKLDADEVFDYFPMGITPEETIAMLGNKKISVTENLLQVAFYNHFSKKNEVFSFKFHEGKLYGITRPGTNTLPTNDVWTAFQLVELRSNMQKLKEVLDKLEK